MLKSLHFSFNQVVDFLEYKTNVKRFIHTKESSFNMQMLLTFILQMLCIIIH